MVKRFFKVKRELAGIILAFSAAGIFATGADTQAYQAVAKQRDQQELKLDSALDSEFISAADQKLLNQKISAYDKVEDTATRRTLRKKITQDNQALSQVQEHLQKTEAAVAKKEYQQLAQAVAAVAKKGQEDFILADDTSQVQDLQDELSKLAEVETVQPIRTVAGQVSTLAAAMKTNQEELKSAVAELRKANETSAELAKKAYLSDSEKSELQKDQQENARFFEDAQELATVATRKTASQELITRLQDKQEAAEKDFKNKGQADKLLASADTLLAANDLTADEKAKLTASRQALTASLELKDYTPGDVAANYTSLQSVYDNTVTSRNQRIEEAKKKAAAEAAEKAAQEKKAAEAAAKAAAEQAAASTTAVPAPTLAGEWYQAPAGYKFLKVESGLTYGQVKQPNNFSLITEAEAAAKYRPGHGNGSAKQ